MTCEYAQASPETQRPRAKNAHGVFIDEDGDGAVRATAGERDGSSGLSAPPSPSGWAGGVDIAAMCEGG
jgi:hypothetical protein